MTVLFFDGFESYSTTASTGLRFSDVYTGSLNAAATGRFSGNGIINNTGCSRDIPAGATWSGPDFTFAGAFKHTATSVNNAKIFTTYQASGLTTGQISLAVDSDGTLRVSRGSTPGTNVIASSAAGVFQNDGAYHFIEFTFKLDASVGTATVKVDGVTVITATGLNSKGGTTTAIASFDLGSGQVATIDDFYVTDGASLGERRIVACRPTADTAQKDWTPNSGTANFSRVNETNADGDTSYISSSTVTNKDLYDVTDLPTSPSTISGVRLISAARKDDATTRAYRHILKSGGTTGNGADIPVNASYTKTEELFLVDPNTSAAWTVSAVNAMQIGVELRT